MDIVFDTVDVMKKLECNLLPDFHSFAYTRPRLQRFKTPFFSCPFTPLACCPGITPLYCALLFLLQIPILPSEKIPFGSTASLIFSANSRPCPFPSGQSYIPATNSWCLT